MDVLGPQRTRSSSVTRRRSSAVSMAGGSAVAMAAPVPTSNAGYAAPPATSAAAAAATAPSEPEVVEDRRRMPDGSVQIRKYIKGRFLGKGGFAKCYAFTLVAKNRALAGKVIAKANLVKARAKQKLMTEIKIHRELQHNMIVKFETFFEDRNNVYIILELCSNHTMMEMVKLRKRISEMEARYFMLQLIDATRYLHKNNIIHRDLKLGNLFLSKEMTIKLGDFGLAAQLADASERKKTICGTPNYIAPEVLDGKCGHSFEVDVWSIGVILYTMLVGKPPFETTDIKQTYKRIRSNAYSFPDNVPVSDDARDLVHRILQTDPTRRPSLEQIMEHPFFSSGHAYMPRCVPLSALQGAIVYSPDELVLASDAVADMLARPIGGLRPVKSRSADAENVALPTENAPASKESSSRAATAAEGSVRVVPSTVPVSLAAASSAAAASSTKRSTDWFGTDGKRTTAGSGASTAAPLSGAGGGGVLSSNINVANTGVATSGLSGAGGSTFSAVGYLATSGTTSSSTATGTARPHSTHGYLTRSTATGTVGASATTSAGAGGSSVSGMERSERPSSRASSVPPASAASSVGGRDSASPPLDLVDAPQQHDHEADALRVVYDTLTRTIDARGDVCAPVPMLGDAASSPRVWVMTWVDYTQKYGLGYMLNNGCVGVYFNDSTKMVLGSDGERFEYMDRSCDDPLRSTLTLSSFPPELNKKVTLLKHFRGYLLEQYRKVENKCPEEVASVALGCPSINMPYIKKWVRTRHAVLFRLSNRTVQINFFDKTAIVLSASALRMTYTGKDGARSHHALATVVAENRPDIVKRLKYTKDILSQLITAPR